MQLFLNFTEALEPFLFHAIQRWGIRVFLIIILSDPQRRDSVLLIVFRDTEVTRRVFDSIDKKKYKRKKNAKKDKYN